MKMLVTGSSGFIGRMLVKELIKNGDVVTSVLRNIDEIDNGTLQITFDELFRDPQKYLSDIDAVFHLAGRAHVSKKNLQNKLVEIKETRKANIELTEKLAKVVFSNSKARLVLMSSIGVYGGITAPGIVIDEQTPLNPHNEYALSKKRAEEIVADLALAWGKEFTIVRSPLVYGVDAPANFGMLFKLANTSLPLPFGKATAERAMIGVKNLSAFLRLVSIHPSACGKHYLITDEPLHSTAEMIKTLRRHRAKKLINIPLPIMWLIFFTFNQQQRYNQLFGSLKATSRLARVELDWLPPYSVMDNLRSDRSSVNQKLNAEKLIYLRVRNMVERPLAMFLLLVFLPLLVIIYVLVKCSSNGPAIFSQYRAGVKHQPFLIFKFRTMYLGTPNISTEELRKSSISTITPIGRLLRRTSLDELPQLINVLRGEMSFIGPRPALTTQGDVLALRTQCGVDVLPPGITGYAQVTGRDDLSDIEKVKRDFQYMRELSVQTDLRILVMTLTSVLKGTGNK